MKKFFTKQEQLQLTWFFRNLGYMSWGDKKKVVRKVTKTEILSGWIDNDGNKLTEDEVITTEEWKETFTLEKLLHAKQPKSLTNIFLMLNAGKIDEVLIKDKNYTMHTESRKNDDIQSVRAFFGDIDFKKKDNTGNVSKYTDSELETIKAKVLPKFDNLPMKPHVIWHTRNGFQFIYFINERDYKMDKDRWDKIQNYIYANVHAIVSNDVDPAVRNISRIVRVPISLHLKDSNTKDEHGNPIPYKCHFAYLANKRLTPKTMPRVHEYEYAFYNDKVKAFFALQDLASKELSPQADRMLGNHPTVGSLASISIKKDLDIYQSKVDDICPENRPEIDQNALERYPAIKAIYLSNYQYFTFLQEHSPSKAMTYDEVKNYVKSVDIRTVLQLEHKELNKPIHSLFYRDSNPSDNFAQGRSGSIIYRCRIEDTSYTDIYDIVSRIKRCSLQNAFNFVEKMFGLNVKKPSKKKKSHVVDERPYDKNTFKTKKNKQFKEFQDLVDELCKSDRKYEPLQKLERVYKLFVFKAWDNAIKSVENTGKFIHYSNVNIMFTKTYVAKELRISEKQAQCMISALEILELLSRVDGEDNLANDKYKKPNYYYVVCIDEHFKKTFQNTTDMLLETSIKEFNSKIFWNKGYQWMLDTLIEKQKLVSER